MAQTRPEVTHDEKNQWNEAEEEVTGSADGARQERTGVAAYEEEGPEKEER